VQDDDADHLAEEVEAEQGLDVQQNPDRQSDARDEEQEGLPLLELRDLWVPDPPSSCSARATPARIR
jgi:hypothetical protein